MVYSVFQSVILFALLSVSLWHVGGRIAPQWRAGQQQRLALGLMSPLCPRLLNKLGLKLLPQVAQHCGTGCSSCGTCG